MKTDYFNFQLFKEDGYALVLELTNLGKEQEVLAIPSHIEGLPVTQIGRQWGMMGSSSKIIESENLKKVYIPYTVTDMIRDAFNNCTNLKEVVVLPADKLIGGWEIFDISEVVVITEELDKSLFGENDDPQSIIPNLIYYYNYENSPNSNYYWFDSITGTNLYLNPSEPTREGYIFTGWYLESKCETEWDMTLPTSEEEKLELYAGWKMI